MMKETTKIAIETLREEYEVNKAYTRNEWEKICKKAGITFQTFRKYNTLEKTIIRKKIWTIEELVDIINNSIDDDCVPFDFNIFFRVENNNAVEMTEGYIWKF